MSVELTAMTCDCGGVYALQEHFREKKKRDGGTWWCPYCGSRRAYTETEVQKLTKDLEEKQRRLTLELSRHDQTKEALKHKEYERRAAKAQATKLRKRIQSGICPCCDRLFEDLQQHIQTDHPDFVAETAQNETEESPDASPQLTERN